MLCHLNPSDVDPGYQLGLAERGAWLEFDMIGMGFYYADQDGQSPSPDDDDATIARLVAEARIDAHPAALFEAAAGAART